MADHAKSPALQDVLAEMERQDAKWGADCNHAPMVWGAILQEEVGEYAEAVLHYEFGGPAAIGLREEAVQVAAVALQIVECLDRHEWLCVAKKQAEIQENG